MSGSSHDVLAALPHSVEAEKAILGLILRAPERFNYLLDKVSLKAEYFFVELHKKIYEMMIALDQESNPIDILTIGEKLYIDFQEKNSNFDPSFLIELTESCPVAQNIEYYAIIVCNKYYLRRVITTCQETIERASRSQGEVSEFITDVEKTFLEITNDAHREGGLVPAKDVLVSTLEALEKRIASEGKVTGVTTGFVALDNITGGWQKSDLIILAARPGMGKTGLALNLCMNTIKKQSSKVAIFTLEMSRSQLMERILSSESRVDSTSLRKGDLSEEDQDRLIHAARQINEKGSNLVIDETPGITLSELRSRCKRYQRESGLDFVVIDYLQLMSASSTARKQGREREISEISTGLKALAKELCIPIIACAQLNRGPDARPDKRPRMSDLRESGSMEQDADLILFIYRDDYYNNNSEDIGKAEIIVSKNRHGETSSVQLAWLPNFVSFHNLAEDSVN